MITDSGGLHTPQYAKSHHAVWIETGCRRTLVRIRGGMHSRPSMALTSFLLRAHDRTILNIGDGVND